MQLKYLDANGGTYIANIVKLKRKLYNNPFDAQNSIIMHSNRTKSLKVQSN